MLANRFPLTFLLLVAVLTGAAAQDFRQRYAEAKSYYADGRYDKSLDAFKTLMVYDAKNPFQEYAQFYYALSAYQLKYRVIARNALLRLESQSPAWPQMDEVRYWVALMYFEDGEPFRAMKYLSQLKPDDAIRPMKEKFLRSIQDPEVLRMLLEDSKDQLVALILIESLLQERTSASVDEARMLMATHDLPEDDFTIPEKEELSGPRRITMMFPFLLPTLDGKVGVRKNQHALDLYNGMVMALDSPRRAGAAVELQAYDTERNADKIRQLTLMPECASTDVLVGPLFSEELPMLREFANRNGLPMLHPASSNPEFLSNNPQGFLFLPSYQTIGKRSAEYAHASGKGPCFIFYEKTQKDSMMAAAFRQRALELGVRVKAFTSISPETAATAFPVARSVGYREHRDSMATVFLATESELIFSRVMNSLNQRKDRTLLMGQESWLEKPLMDFNKAEELQVVFAAPFYVELRSASYKTFHKDYIRMHGLPPSAYARIGFACGRFLTRVLTSEGDFMDVLAKTGRQTGSFGTGFEYGGARDNQDVPLVSFVNGVLKRVDRRQN